MNWIHNDTCPLCGREGCKSAYAKAIPYPAKHGTPKSLEPHFLQLIYHECKDCGFRFMSPRPDPESYLQFYADMTYRDSRPMPQQKMDDDELARGKRIQALIPEDAKTHLDVGCSRGYLLDLSQKQGREVIGVEPNRSYIIDGIPTVSSLDDIEGEFDVVTCIHVLEHVGDPKAVAERLKELTRPGGTLIVEVPAETTPGESSGLPHPWAFQLPTVKYLFSDLKLRELVYPTKHPVFVMTKDKLCEN